MFSLPLLTLIWALLAAYAHSEKQAVEARLATAAQMRLESARNALSDELDGLLEDLRLLLTHVDLKAYLSSGGEQDLQRLQVAWNYFSASKRIYGQVRLLDASGQEIVRINHAGGATLTVPPDQLQDKSNRYYFIDSMRLRQGQMFVSALDLNVEQGRIEQPLKPMLRLAAPVFRSEQRRGIVVLNYLAERLLRRLDANVSGPLGQLLLLNRDGYYLKGPKAGREWGFMYPHRSGLFRFQDSFSEPWKAMTTAANGQLLNPDGLFTYAWLQFPPPTADWNGSQPRQWVLVHFLPQAVLTQALSPSRHFAVLVGVILSLLALALSLYLAYLANANQEQQQSGAVLDARLQSILRTAPDGIMSFDGAGRLESVNPAAEKMFECSYEQLRLYPIDKLLPGMTETLDALSDAVKLSENGNSTGVLRRELALNTCNEDSLPVELALSLTRIGEQTTFTGILRDVSERREAAERIRRQVYFDDLTGLPNRAMLRTELDAALASAQRRRIHGALLFMDLDNFKTINDSLGHLAGDELLKKTAHRIRDCLRSDDRVARLGGDEFMALLPSLGSDRREASLLARELADKLRAIVGRPVLLKGHEYVVTPSIGVVLFPEADDSTDSLLKQADTAMYSAKAAGRNSTRFFQPRMQAEADQRLSIAKELHKAVKLGELRLFLQPQVNLASEHVVGAEALIRWQHPARGLLSPGAFIPQSEELGLSAEIGDWVLAEGLRQLSVLLANPACASLDFLAINISPQHFRLPEFLPKLVALLAQHGVPAQRLELEITENLLLHDIDDAASKMHALKAKGIRFAIDDFGTGFSSLRYLRQLPLTRLKIDRSFVDGVHEDPHNASIVDTVIAMARIQGLELTAEGVETELEKDWLLQRGCHQVQGFLYARPLPLEAFMVYCAAQGCEAAS